MSHAQHEAYTEQRWEAFQEWFDGFRQERYFLEYLEKDPDGYDAAIQLLAKDQADLIPADPVNLTDKQFSLLLALTKGSYSLWDRFEEWAWDRWSNI